MGLFILEDRRLGGDLVAACKYIKDVHQDLGEHLFTRAPQGMMRSNGHKPLQEKLLYCPSPQGQEQTPPEWCKRLL